MNEQAGLKSLFQSKPDLLITKNRKKYHVLDTKWKLINCSDSDNNYNISQSYIYQLFAYGHKYLNDCGDMILIYPKHHQFRTTLEYFYLSEKLRL